MAISRQSLRSGGRASTVSDADELDRVYEQLGSRIGTRTEQREVSAAFAFGGLALLLGGLAPGCAGAAAWRDHDPNVSHAEGRAGRHL